MERTNEEILARIEVVKGEDWMGTQTSDLLDFLPFAVVKPWLKAEVTEEKWTASARDAETIKAKMLEYMPFAWEKANNCRGLSAGRSLDHMKAWLWMLGHDDAPDFISDYDRYGKPQLRAICEAFGWDWREWDDGTWVNNEDGPNLGVPEKVDPLPLAA